jgi:serine/threonine protein kinase
MPICHECDSTVADNDIFCPFCGISLSAAAPPAEAPGDEFESTIMMTPEEATKLASGDAANSAEPFHEPESAQDEADAYVYDEVDPLALTDVPEPSPIADVIKTSDNIRTTSEYEKFESPEPIEAETTGPEGPAAESFADQFSFQETLISAPLPDVRDLGATPDLGGIESQDESRSFEAAEPAHEESDSATAEEDRASVVHNETDEPEERGISIPNEELELEDTSAPSMFDSVRIIEGQLPFSQEDVATRIPDFGNSATGAAPAEVERIAEPEAVEPSGTSPNIGKPDTDGRRSAKLKPLTEGTVLNGRYEIVRKIGGGGMGAVYLASDNNLGGVLRAVKEMVQAHIEDDQQEKAVNDFKRESMILSTLDHPSIPTIFDYFYDEAESRFYLVMKYISGGDLASRLRSAPEGKIDELTVADWAIQITDVLQYLHNQPSTIVYRDLKPSNIMIDGNSGRVMLIDFGIARSISQKEEKGVTAVGTMGYAPPELFSGNVEPRSDIYSLGSTMFHLLTGADPQSNPLLIFDFQKNPRPRQINPRLSDQMERILMRAVEYSADARFKDAAEMGNVLKEHCEQLRAGNVTYGTGQAPVAVSLANQQVFCGFCGQRIVATDLFCAFCGAKQPIAQQGVHSEIYSSSSAGTARLIIEGTSELTTPIYQLTKPENLVGRRDPMSNIFPEVDLSKYDPQTKISRRHARIWRDGHNFLVEDLGSSNGTILTPALKDSFRLSPHTPQPLTNGDRIKIGDTILHFVVN